MDEIYDGHSRAGHGIPYEWEEAMRNGEPTGNPFIDGIAEQIGEQANMVREGDPAPEPSSSEDPALD